MAGPLDFIGDLFNRAATKRAVNEMNDARNQYTGLNGNITADTASGQNAGQDAQMSALRQLQGLANNGGQDAQSQAALRQAQMSNAQQAGSANQALQQQAAQQGTLNSGRALMMQQANNQAAANSNNMAGTQASADASNRALQALGQAGQLGGQVSGAQNAINQFNATQLQNAQNQSFANNLNKAGGVASADQTLAGNNNAAAQRARDSAGAIGQAAVSAATMGI